MNSQLHYLVARQRHVELRTAERQRLMDSALAATRHGVRPDSATKRLSFRHGIKLGRPLRSRADSLIPMTRRGGDCHGGPMGDVRGAGTRSACVDEVGAGGDR